MSKLETAKCRVCHTTVTYNHDEQATKFKATHPDEYPVVICNDCDDEIKDDRDAEFDCDCGHDSPPHPARQHEYVFSLFARRPHQQWVINGGIVQAVTEGQFKAELGEIGLDYDS